MVCTLRMPWASVELEPEVAQWLESLPEREFGRAEFYIRLVDGSWSLAWPTLHAAIARRAPRAPPYLGPRRDAVRVSYWIAAGRRIILLTVFRKQRRQERDEIERAYKAMQRCIEETHVAEEDHD
jgi:hypothetical protein